MSLCVLVHMYMCLGTYAWVYLCIAIYVYDVCMYHIICVMCVCLVRLSVHVYGSQLSTPLSGAIAVHNTV